MREERQEEGERVKGIGEGEGKEDQSGGVGGSIS